MKAPIGFNRWLIILISTTAAATLSSCSKSKRGGGNDDCPAGTDCSEPTPTPMNATLTCIDADGDGYGVDCALGFDCNDNDPVQIGREICDDGKDNDCNDLIDNGCVSACAGVLNCKNSPVGGPNGQPFDLNPSTSGGGVAVGPDGALILSSTASTNSYIWIANTQQGTISKINTKSKDGTPYYVEEARYATANKAPYSSCYGSGPSNNPYPNLCGFFDGVDPSRTTVNGNSDVFIGNRHAGRVTMIKGDNTRCRDNNGDTMITTATGANYLTSPWVNGKSPDDCVYWSRLVADATDNPKGLARQPNGTPDGAACSTAPAAPNLVRAMAAQDIRDTDEHYVWVGDTTYPSDCTNPGTIWKLDATTGEVVLRTRIDKCSPYGFALDGKGNLWVSCRNINSGNLNRNQIGRLDTTKCVDTASCTVAPTCVGEGLQPAGDCDKAVKQTIETPIAPASTGEFVYGITVDAKQRVWLGSNNGMWRYDPAQAAGSRIAQAKNGNTAMSGWVLGVTVFGQTNVFAYGARNNDKVALVNEAMEWTDVSVKIGSADVPATWGMAADVDGKVWAISRTISVAKVIVRNSNDLTDVTVSDGFANLAGPYTYSDMTGSQLRYATNPDGYFRHVFDGCMGRGTSWKNLVWDADVPAGTQLRWSVRTADKIENLPSAATVVAQVPSDAPPVDLGAKLQAAGITPGPILEVEVLLRSDNTDPTKPQTPKLRSLDVGYVCDGGTLI